MSEWNRRDQDLARDRYGQGEQGRRGSRGDAESRWRTEDAPRTFGSRAEGYREDYPGAGDEAYGGRSFGYGRGSEREYGEEGRYGQGDRYPSQAYGGGRYRGDSPGREGYARPPFGETGGGRQPMSQRQRGDDGQADLGQNDRLQRVSDGEQDRGHFLGGGMNRGSGEHRGRGPKNYTRSDERIREDVNDRLSDDSWLDASEIDVQVSSGEVTLLGTVGSRDDKRRAEDVAEEVSGVKHVQNNLRVQPAGAGQTQGSAQSGVYRSDAAGTTGRGAGSQ